MEKMTTKVRVCSWSEYEDEDGNYFIQAFGRLSSGESCYVQIAGFEPYFYIKVPLTMFETRHILQIKEAIIDNLWDYDRYNTLKDEYGGDATKAKDIMKSEMRKKISKIEFEDLEDLYAGFRNHEKTRFAKIYFRTSDMGKKTASLIQKKGLRVGSTTITKDDVYESNIPSLLRFFHVQSIDPAGIIEFPTDKSVEINASAWTYCNKAIRVSSREVSKCTDEGLIIPFKVISWDIECYSQTKIFFPCAKPSYFNIARLIIDSIGSYAKAEGILTDIINNLEFRDKVSEEQKAKVVKRLVSMPQFKELIESDDEYDGRVDEMVQIITKIIPKITGDPIIQIGICVRMSNDLNTTSERHILNLGGCSDWENKEANTKIHCFDSEIKLIEDFSRLIREEIDPDFIIDYNGFGFDYKYLFERGKELTGDDSLMRFGRLRIDDGVCSMKKNKLSVASGVFELDYLEMEGREQLDCLVIMRREQTLDNYKLDTVSSTFIRDDVVKFKDNIITSKTLPKGVKAGDYIRFEVIANSATPIEDGRKFIIKSIDGCNIELTEKFPLESIEGVLQWCLAKDDLHPRDIFECFKKGDEDRAKIAKYCLMDCDLVLNIISKLEILNNAAGMANVCTVPLNFLYLRGQGIKTHSLVARECRKRGQVIKTMWVNYDEDDDDKYEGAIVLDPKIGMYLDDPIAVGDFNSLYPSEMIASNLSHDSWVWTKRFNLDDELIGIVGDTKFEAIEGETYFDATYDDKDRDGNKIGRTVVRFRQPKGQDDIGTIPLILQMLLKARKVFKKKMESEKDPFLQAVWNGLQLAYKITANSIYGQMGSKVGPVRKVEIAAATTAGGRRNIMIAKEYVESNYDAEVIYGDTDSIFIKFNIDKALSHKEKIQKAIELGEKATKEISAIVKKPHNIEYEKTFYPFILLRRKGYVGMKYEHNPEKGKKTSMGIVLKRRDNPDIVKDIYGGAIDIIMKERDIKMAQGFVKEQFIELMKGNVSIDKLSITKSLSDGYKDPSRIAHAVLAQRMGKRDPNNKPKAGDRIEFVFIVNDEKKTMDKMEHIDYVKANPKIKIDYLYYLEEQLKNPLNQLFKIAISDLDGFPYKKNYYESLRRNLVVKHTKDEIESIVDKDMDKTMNKIMFSESPHLKEMVQKLKGSRSGQMTMTSFFMKK